MNFKENEPLPYRSSRSTRRLGTLAKITEFTFEETEASDLPKPHSWLALAVPALGRRLTGACPRAVGNVWGRIAHAHSWRVKLKALGLGLPSLLSPFFLSLSSFLPRHRHRQLLAV